ncbi:MAG: hypothetical protein WCY58_10330 [Mariniphaga sp.]
MLLIFAGTSCQNKPGKTTNGAFPAEMVAFIPFNDNPVFSGTGKDTWDRQIRERGYILKEENLYRMWYSGYNGGDTTAKYRVMPRQQTGSAGKGIPVILFLTKNGQRTCSC